MSKCEACRFFANFCECHRHAPIPIKSNEEYRSCFPRVSPYQWCGDFALKTEINNTERVSFSIEYVMKGTLQQKVSFNVFLDGSIVYTAKDERDMHLFGAELRAKIGTLNE